jgi:hypothetical protein
MKLRFQRVIAALISPVVLAAGLAAGTATTTAQGLLRTFGVPAVVGPTVLGGGATLPVPAYISGTNVIGACEPSGTAGFGVAGSIFGYFATITGGLNVEYCATGSGRGKSIFDGAANTVDIPCGNAASGSTQFTFGFLPPNGIPAQTYPTLAGTDVPLSQADYSSYIADHPAPMEPVELPALFGSIAIVYHDNALSSSTGRLTLTDAQICGIYNGSITTFGALLGNSDTTKIIPLYRADSSGTSFNFSNNLATRCSGFNGNQAFTLADPKLPKYSIGAIGTVSVIDALSLTNGAIGYVETGYLTNLPERDRANQLRQCQKRAQWRRKRPISRASGCRKHDPSELYANERPGHPGHRTGDDRPADRRSVGNCVKVRPAFRVCQSSNRLSNRRGNVLVDEQRAQRLAGRNRPAVARKSSDDADAVQTPGGYDADHDSRRSRARSHQGNHRLVEPRLHVRADISGHGKRLYQRVMHDRFY